MIGRFETSIELKHRELCVNVHYTAKKTITSTPVGFIEAFQIDDVFVTDSRGNNITQKLKKLYPRQWVAINELVDKHFEGE
jgi:hypothetical protein